MAVNFAKQQEPNSGRARPQGPRRDADLRCCRSAFSFVIQSMISTDFGFRRIRAGVAHNPRSCTGGDRVGESAFYVTGSILTRQAHAFPVRELHATCIASFFWHLIASQREVRRSSERHSRRNSKTCNEFPHAVTSLHRCSCGFRRSSGASASDVTHITKAPDVTRITKWVFHVVRCFYFVGPTTRFQTATLAIIAITVDPV